MKMMEWIGLRIINDSQVNRFIIGDNEVNVNDTLHMTLSMIEYFHNQNHELVKKFVCFKFNSIVFSCFLQPNLAICSGTTLKAFIKQ